MGDEPSSLLLFGISLGVLTTFIVVLWAINAIKARVIMSRQPSAPATPAGGLDQSVDQSAQTSLEVQTTPAAASGLPDMDAEKWELPRVSRFLTDEEFITFLAAQKLRSGGYRMSANKIVQTVGGDRTQVLAIVRAVRGAPAAYPEKTPEQQAARGELGLDRV